MYTGGRKKGSTNKATQLDKERVKTLKELVLPHCDKAIQVLVSLLDNESPAIQQSAASTLLDRGYGKPSQHIEQETKSLVVVADAQQAELGRRIAFLLERAGKTDLLQ